MSEGIKEFGFDLQPAEEVGACFESNLSINGTVDIQIASCSTNFQIENAERFQKNKT